MIKMCPRCGEDRLVRSVISSSSGEELYDYLCPDCSLQFTIEDETREEELLQSIRDFFEEFKRY